MSPPNIMLISIDTLRADHLSCYGYHRLTTPNFDQIGEESVIYENAYSTGAWTPPAHASMVTGFYPSVHGTVHNNRLRKQIRTLGELLCDQGYKTAGFVNNSQVGELVGLERGYETFIEVWKGTQGKSIASRAINYVIRNTRELIGTNDHGARRTNDIAREWIAENKNNPFYIFLHYIEPHNPINAPHPFKNRYWNKNSRRHIDNQKVYLVAQNPLICFTDNIRLNDEEITALKALYDGEISYTDHKIGEFIAYLKKEHIYDETLIIITADHGEHFGEHNLYSHVASLYEPIVHIPMIIKYPAWFNKRGRISNLVQLIDIYPTVADTVGLNRESFRGIHGQSLLDTDMNDGYHRYIIAEWEGRIPSFVSRRMKDQKAKQIVQRFREPIIMMRERNYKYILHAGGGEELYDLETDKSELNNIVEADKEIAGRCREKLSDWQPLTEEVGSGPESLDEITRKNLEDLGYM